jgi:hypothetical protein
MQDSKRAVIIMGIALILSAAVFGAFYYSAQSVRRDSLAVTGSAKTRVTSDQGKLVIMISHVAPLSGLSTGYAAVTRDLHIVESFLDGEGISDTTVTESPVSSIQQYDQNQEAETRYELQQTVTIQSDDVVKLTDVSKKVPSLTSQGAIVSIQSLEYYYSKLPELRVSLLGEAVQDAKARAAKIAEGTGRKIGSVEGASNGVVQVLPVNSVDISDYGTYDTSSIEKDVMVTLKASFALK